MAFDRSTDYGKRVARRLEEESVIWLTTVTPGGQPLPVPIWFIWDGDDEVLVYSRPNTPKLRNIAENSKVSLNLNSTPSGGNVIQFDGEAHHDSAAPPASDVDAFVAKYNAGFKGLEVTPEEFASDYSAAVRVRLTKVRGH